MQPTQLTTASVAATPITAPAWAPQSVSNGCTASAEAMPLALDTWLTLDAEGDTGGDGSDGG